MYGRRTSKNRAGAEIHWVYEEKWKIAWSSYGGRIGWEVWTGDIFVIPGVQSSVSYRLLTFSMEVFVLQNNLSYYISYSMIRFTYYHYHFLGNIGIKSLATTQKCHSMPKCKSIFSKISSKILSNDKK